MVNTIADVVLTTTATKLSSTSVRANWVLLSGKALAGAARVGDSSISTSRGGVIPTTSSTLLFPPSGNTNAYDLSTIYALGTANDTLAVCYGTI